jgi:hypothetical protein
LRAQMVADIDEDIMSLQKALHIIGATSQWCFRWLSFRLTLSFPLSSTRVLLGVWAWSVWIHSLNTSSKRQDVVFRYIGWKLGI